MDAELERISKIVLGAKTPQELFGADLDERIFKKLAKSCHPDKFPTGAEYDLATKTFQRLSELWQMKDDPAPSVGVAKIVGTKAEYVVGSHLTSGDLCEIFACKVIIKGHETPGIIKMVRDENNADLLENEALVLQQLLGKNKEFDKYLPKFLENVGGANTFGFLPGFFTLKEVREDYPGGVDPKDMAWMARRLFDVLGFTHTYGVVHGGIVPTHILIHPKEHGLVLIDWTASAQAGGQVGLASLDFESWYPGGILKRSNAMPGMDINMAAKCLIYVLGGDPILGFIPSSVPDPISSFLRGCLFEDRMAPQNVWQILSEFDKMIEKLWGPKKFHPFQMKRKS